MEQKGKILIIDDNEDVLFALNLLLEPYVEKIKSNHTALPHRTFHDDLSSDVVLLDMNFRRDAISGQEGFDCLEQIHASGSAGCGHLHDGVFRYGQSRQSHQGRSD